MYLIVYLIIVYLIITAVKISKPELPLCKKTFADDEIREELLSDASGSLDLMLVPGLAFTTSGKRLGRLKSLNSVYTFRSRPMIGHKTNFDVKQPFRPTQ